MYKVLKVSIWLILFMVLTTLAADYISAPSTIENIVGFLIIVAVIIITVETRCLTTIKFKREHEK